MLFDQTIDNRAACRQAAESRLLLLSHEAAVAVHVGAEHSGELAFHKHLGTAILLSINSEKH
jgi:hypothetical protein